MNDKYIERPEAFDKVKYNNDYIKNNYDSLRIVVPKGIKAKLQQYCKSQGISLNKLINNYIDTLPLNQIDSQSEKWYNIFKVWNLL